MVADERRTSGGGARIDLTGLTRAGRARGATLAGGHEEGGAGKAPASRAVAAIRRHRTVVGLGLVALVAVLLFVPTLPTASTGVGTAPSATASAISVLPDETPPNAAGTAGTTVGGVACGPGVRQVPWSDYAPICEPAWHGSNGGATSRGVTATTITFNYRTASTEQLSELYALVPPAVIGTNTEEVATLQTYINTFNREFELYGRHVVLKTFQGKGDFISEDLGEDQTQAQEDAVTAADTLKTFADVSLVDSSAVYATDLSDQHVVTSSLYENAASWYAMYSPWEYTPGPNCTKSAVATGAILGKQLGGLPASLAGTATLQKKTRVYGLIYPQNPQAAQCATEDVADLARYGQKVVDSVGVQFNLAQLINQSSSAVAQMKAKGVTTVILSSADPITPTFYMQAADKLDYHPEWWFQSYFSGGNTNSDSLASLFPADQVAHSFSVGNVAKPLTEEEAIKAYDLGNPEKDTPPIPSFVYTYQTVLQLFDALQLAGPDLTPANFERAMKLIPTSAPGGMLGGWSGKDGPYDPSSNYAIVKYDPTRVNPLDGKPGAFTSCDGGQRFDYDKDGADVPSHQQITCATGHS